MKYHHSNGFTLTEFIMIITIISILAAMVVPKFIDFKAQTREKTTISVASGLNVASATNYQLGRTGSAKAITVSNCQDVVDAFPSAQEFPANCTIDSLTITGRYEENCQVRCTYNGVEVIKTFIGYKTP